MLSWFFKLLNVNINLIPKLDKKIFFQKTY